jgi:hypothetical protein
VGAVTTSRARRRTTQTASAAISAPWVADHQATVKSVEDAGPSISREDLRAAVLHVRDSTQLLFFVDLSQLDVPESDAGNQAKTELDNLEMKLAQQLRMVGQAVQGNIGAVALASMLTTALSTATNDVKSTSTNSRTSTPTS